MAIFRKREQRKRPRFTDQPGGDRPVYPPAETSHDVEPAELAVDTTAWRSPFILIEDAEIVQHAATIGTKAGNLARMRLAGIPVPPLAVVRPCALAEHLKAGALTLDSLAGHSGQQREELRRALVDQPVPPDVAKAVVSAYAAICGTGTHSVAVRSSSGEEDGGASSYAGQFESYLGVSGESALLTRLRQCWASSISDRVVNYSTTRDGGPSPFDRMAVIIQRQLFPDKAGVLFSRHPLRREEDILYVESNFGTAESVVGGLSIPDSQVVSRATGAVLESHIANKTVMTVVPSTEGGEHEMPIPHYLADVPVMSRPEIDGLVRLAMEIEQFFHGPQDIEWAIEADKIWIVQARPITA
jgi:pyruvate,water dikinase